MFYNVPLLMRRIECKLATGSLLPHCAAYTAYPGAGFQVDAKNAATPRTGRRRVRLQYVPWFTNTFDANEEKLLRNSCFNFCASGPKRMFATRGVAKAAGGGHVVLKGLCH